MADEDTKPQTARAASVVAVVLAVVGIVVAFLPGWGFWLAWILGSVAAIVGGIAEANRRKGSQPPDLARLGWIGGIVAFALGWVTLIAIN